MTTSATINPRLLDIIVCPKTRGELILNAETGELWSQQAKLAFPIKNGIPILLIDQARPLTKDELS